MPTPVSCMRFLEVAQLKIIQELDSKLCYAFACTEVKLTVTDPGFLPGPLP